MPDTTEDRLWRFRDEMTEERRKTTAHRCEAEGCLTLTHYHFCARCDFDRRESKRERRRSQYAGREWWEDGLHEGDAGQLSYSFHQRQGEQEVTWKKKRE